MNDMTCPWCEVALELTVDQIDEQQCPDCLTSWRYEDEPVIELLLAA
jgi:hypothetical protein